jgi:hypothetical protein
MGSVTTEALATPDITASSTDADHLLSLVSASNKQRAVFPFRLTQLVVARFDMAVVEAVAFLNLSGSPPIQTSQSADAEFHVHLRRVIDRYRLECLSSRTHQADITTRSGREATIIRSTRCIPKKWKRGAPTIEACIPYSRYSQRRSSGFIVAERITFGYAEYRARGRLLRRSKYCAKAAPSRIGGA